MTGSASEDGARDVLAAAGYSVHRVPRHPTEKRADFVATRDDHQLVVEVKGRAFSDFYCGIVEEADAEGVASDSRRLGLGQGLAKKIGDAERQLLSTPVQASAYRVLWISCLHSEADFLLEQALRTLYGLERLWVRKDPALPRSVSESAFYERLCFYYDHSAFWRHDGIDAAILTNGSHRLLCLNDQSENYERFRQAETVMSLGDVVCDPLLLEAAGEAFVLEREFERTDAREQWLAVKRKYGVMTQRPHSVEWVGLMTLRRPGRRGGRM